MGECRILNVEFQMTNDQISTARERMIIPASGYWLPTDYWLLVSLLQHGELDVPHAGFGAGAEDRGDVAISDRAVAADSDF